MIAAVAASVASQMATPPSSGTGGWNQRSWRGCDSTPARLAPAAPPLVQASAATAAMTVGARYRNMAPYCTRDWRMRCDGGSTSPAPRAAVSELEAKHVVDGDGRVVVHAVVGHGRRVEDVGQAIGSGAGI